MKRGFALPIQLIHYSGDPLDNKTLLQSLGIQGNYTYIVATLAMESSRRKLAPPHQRDLDDRPHLVFHKALRHWLRQKRVPLLTRAEERVALLRAAEQVAQDPELARQLRHDVFAWRDALAELAAREVDPAHGLPPDLEAQLVNPSIGRLLLELQATYQNLQRSEQRQPFEDAAAAFLTRSYSATPIVILEGFTFFTPLQRRFIEVVTSQGKTVILLYPYCTEQPYGFEIMRTTYDLWLGQGATEQEFVTNISGRPDSLEFLQTALFADNAQPAPADDGSVEVHGYGHRHQEVAACIQRLSQLIQDDVSPDDIAIITRNAGNIEALLREEAELQGLPVSLSVPPRLLLLTPLGRFALTLYEIWVDNTLRVSAEQLETLLASGWLGADVQSTVDLFGAVRAQFFARCESTEDWMQSLTQLRLVSASEKSPRLAAHLVDGRTILLWRHALERIQALCKNLFASGQQSIGGHVRLLLDELAQLAPEQMRDAERAVLQRIEEALMEVASAASLEMSAAEFGGVLNSMVRDYQQAESENNEIEPSEEAHAATIWVTTPEGIDGRDRKHVFYLGIDSQRAPRAYAESWPFYERSINKHQQQERYMFLTVVRAARQRLYLSYARADEGEILRPSPYLEEVCKLLGCDLSLPVTVADQVVNVPTSDVAPAQRARRATYTLAEIAHAGLCPYRYKLERLSPAASVYRDPFQIRFLAEGVWLDQIMQHLRDSRGSAGGIEPVYQLFLEAMEATRANIESIFPGLRELDWHTVERYVQSVLRYTAENRAKNEPYLLSIIAPGPATVVVTDGDRTISVDGQIRHALHIGSFNHPFLNDLLLEEWILPGSLPQDDQAQAVELSDGTEVFASLYHGVDWWRKAAGTSFSYHNIQGQQARTAPQRKFFDSVRQNYIALQSDLRERIAVIETGHYPKHSGDHCRYCPVHLDCLGLEP